MGANIEPKSPIDGQRFVLTFACEQISNNLHSKYGRMSDPNSRIPYNSVEPTRDTNSTTIGIASESRR